MNDLSDTRARALAYIIRKHDFRSAVQSDASTTLLCSHTCSENIATELQLIFDEITTFNLPEFHNFLSDSPTELAVRRSAFIPTSAPFLCVKICIRQIFT